MDPRARLAGETIEEFKRRSEEYERLVREVTERKVEVRAEIAQMEIQLRALKDQIQAKQQENS